MQDLLAQQFEALGPDVGLRLANLRTLLSSLTPQEARFVRLYLQSFPVPEDIVSLFPTDILVEITPYLSPLDIVNILNVSKTWRKSWSQRDVVRALAKHHMPNFLHFYAYRNRLQSSAETDQSLFDAFYQAAGKFSIRQQGLFQSMISNTDPWLHFLTRDRFFTLEPTDSIKDWDDVFPDRDDEDQFSDDRPNKTYVPCPWRISEYCSGKVAWQPMSDNINLASLTFVDDLRSQQRRVYQVPDPVFLHGYRACLEALGNELVVVSAGRTCHAWDLETGEHDSVTLPAANIYRVNIEKKRIYILSGQADVYIWTFRRGLRGVDTNAAGEDGINGVCDAGYGQPIEWDAGREGLFDILPHPVQDDTFYLLSLKEKSDKELVVHEFNYDGTVRLHTTALPEVYSFTRKWSTCNFDFAIGMEREGLNGGVPVSLPDEYFRMCTHKVDTYSNYALCQFFLKGRLLKPREFRGLYDDIKNNSFSYLDADHDYCLGYTVFFNALTASVSTSPFINNISHSGHSPPFSTCWSGQQIEIISAPTDRNDLRFCMLLVSELNGQKRAESMDDLPVHCPSSLNSLKEFVPVNHRVTKRLDNTPAKPGKMVQGQRCSNIVSRYLTERFKLMPSIPPIYGLDFTFEYDNLRDRTHDDDETFDDDDGDIMIMADEDFLICRGPKGYVAWSFCHDMEDRNVRG